MRSAARARCSRAGGLPSPLDGVAMTQGWPWAGLLAVGWGKHPARAKRASWASYALRRFRNAAKPWRTCSQPCEDVAAISRATLRKRGRAFSPSLLLSREGWKAAFQRTCFRLAVSWWGAISPPLNMKHEQFSPCFMNCFMKQNLKQTPISVAISSPYRRLAFSCRAKIDELETA